MQADEKVRVMRIGKSDAVRQREVSVVGAGQKNGPAVRGQQGNQPARPIQGEILFVIPAQHAAGPGVFPAVTGVKDDHPVRAGQSQGVLEQRANRFLNVQGVEEWLAVDRLRRKTETQLDSLPHGHQASGSKSKNTIAGDQSEAWLRSKARWAWWRQIMVSAPAHQGHPRFARLYHQ